jgi:hypothetical protein
MNLWPDGEKCDDDGEDEEKAEKERERTVKRDDHQHHY